MSKVKKKITLGEVDFEAFKVYLEVIIDQKLDQKLEEKGVVTKEDIKLLPTKKEFFDRMDKLSSELEEHRQEREVEKNQVSGYEERITVLENIHPQGKHTPLS